MKNLLLFGAVALLAVQAAARDFAYEYEGQTLNYTVLDEDARTCQVMAGTEDEYGHYFAAHDISGDLVIPSVANDGNADYTVTGIGSFALGCPNITSLVLPNTLTNIGMYAFYNCNKITSIDIPESVKEIGHWAFFNLSSLTKVQFASVEALCSIQFANIGANPLNNCGHLYIDGEEITEIVVPEGIKVLNATFPYCRNLTSVTLPSTLTEIGEWCFGFCDNLTSIEIPDGVTKIGDCTFYFCTGLPEMKLPEGVTSIGIGAFQVCRNMRSINIPDRVQSIGNLAFQNCESLESITIPETITEIPNYAFSYCLSLQEFDIPKTVNRLGEGAFQCCDNLKSIIIPEGVTEILKNTFQACRKLESADILGPVTIIGENAFSTCTNLSSISIPETVTEIGKNAFGACTKFTSIYIPASVKKIRTFAFVRCDNIERSNFASIEALCNIEFEEYYSSPITYSHNIYIDGKEITEIEIPDGVKTIHRTFYEASHLTSVTIPGSVEKIESYSFQNCTSLTSLTMPNSVTEVGAYALADCDELKTLTLSTSLKDCGWGAFGSPAIEDIYYLTTDPVEFDSWIFYDEDATLHVAPGGVEAAKSVKPWCYFTTITDDTSSINSPVANGDDLDYNEPYEVYSTSGIRVGNNINAVAPGLYIIRQGNNTAKISVR